MLRLESVSFSFPGRSALFSQLDWQLAPGWTGLVGPNGAGKTTLLGLLAGELTPTDGARIGPSPDVVAFCDQRVDSPSARVTAFARAWDKSSMRWQRRLALVPEQLERWSTLSPGERRRWQVGAALANEPELLLLDEPTNHLDGAARERLIGALAQFRGIGVVVSHDRALLDELCERTAWLERGELALYDGGYDAARAQRELELAARRNARSELAARERQLARRAAGERERTRAADRAISARTRMKGPRDSDARGALAKGRAEHAAAKLGQRGSATNAQLERVREQLDGARVEREIGRSLFVDYEPCAKSRLITLERDAPPHGQLPERLSLVLDRDSRIWLSGPNGAGKSTLIRALLGACALPEARILNTDQDTRAALATAALDRVRALPAAQRARALELVAALGTQPEQLLGTERPSPGEARKLEIALGLSRSVWLVVLDEPTNHLDLPSVERLQVALARYPGALIVATHDAAFARAVCRERWHVAGGHLERSTLSASASEP